MTDYYDGIGAECDMCGKYGARLRENGEYLCSTCNTTTFSVPSELFPPTEWAKCHTCGRELEGYYGKGWQHTTCPTD